jgi:pyruvate kinase
MTLPNHKTKIVCTIGPASQSPEMLEKMIAAGMSVARLNFSHGDLLGHEQVIRSIRETASAAGRRVAIMADLPGPKMRIGRLAREPIELNPGALFTLTTDDIVGDDSRVSVTFERLPRVVGPGDILFLNDGLIQLDVVKAAEPDVRCRVIVGGELRSRKGLNVPGTDLGMSAFTENDRRCLEFALAHGVDAVSQSFVACAADITAVREAAASLGHDPFVIAKIERAAALRVVDEILEAADGIMVARGDLGVEIPIERIAVEQKRLIEKANVLGKPVITATQMLESMTLNRRPTRAESTDVANAILDGSDCVMLSGESAMGAYPVESTLMLGKIAACVEAEGLGNTVQEALKSSAEARTTNLSDLIALSVATTVERVSPAAVIVPTRSGASARRVARFRLPLWIAAVSRLESSCQRLQFSYGVFPVCEADHPEDWREFAQNWVTDHALEGNLVLVTEGPSRQHPKTNNRMEIIDLGRS